MFDKLETLDRFCVNTEFSFDTMFGIINTSSRNIIIVNINTPFISSWVETQLKKHKLVVQKKSYTDFNNYNSLGSFLRIESDKKDVLLLDFLKVSSFTNPTN